jgi:hypothetical protein
VNLQAVMIGEGFVKRAYVEALWRPAIPIQDALLNSLAGTPEARADSQPETAEFFFDHVSVMCVTVRFAHPL